MAQAGWTVMVLLAGDNDLSTAGEIDLEEMRRVGSTPGVHVVAQFDRAGAEGTRRFHVEPAGVAEEIVALGETDCGDPSTLRDFVRWATGRYPADRYALVLWSHGGGWAPADIDALARSQGVTGFSLREANERAATPLGRVLFRSTWMRLLSRSTPAERAICSDDGSGHSLDTVELGHVLAAIARDLGRPIDVLGLDACLMSSLEVAFEVRPFVDVMVASEEVEPSDGWPYARVLRALVAKPDLTARDLGARIVAEYVGDYRERGYEGDVTLAALDLKRLGELVSRLDDLVGALFLDLPAAVNVVWTAQRRAPHFCRQTQWDIARLAENIARLATSDPVRRSAEAVAQGVRSRANGPMIASDQSGPGVTGCGGLGIYLPPLVRTSPYYGELAFASGCRWSGWLSAYGEAVSSARP
jgi:hypothetical protein